MRYLLIFYFTFYSFTICSQNNKQSAFTFSYNHQFPKGELSKYFDKRFMDITDDAGYKIIDLAGIDNSNFSGHSLRSGFATVAAQSGADERSIMAMTGHKTTQMVRRYIQEANLFKNNALNKIKI